MTAEAQQVIEGEVGRFTKNALETVIVSVQTWQGKQRLDVRLFYLADDGTLKPTRKGVSIAAEDCHEFANLVRQGIAAIAGPEGGAK